MSASDIVKQLSDSATTQDIIDKINEIITLVAPTES